MSVTLIQKRQRPGGDGSTKQKQPVRQSKASDLANMIESQNSIFDQMERINSMSHAGLSNPTMTNFMLSSNPAQQASSKQKRRTFKEVIDSIDQQENEVYSLNILSAATENNINDSRSVSLQQNGVTMDYEKFQVAFDNRQSSEYVISQTLGKNIPAIKDSAARPPLPAKLFVQSQNSEGILSRSLLNQMGDGKQSATNDYIKVSQDVLAEAADDKDRTPQGIVKRVMPDKANKDVVSAGGFEKANLSFDPTQLHIMTENSIMKNSKNLVMGLCSQRDPVVKGDATVPQLTDRLNTNLKCLDTSQLSMNQKSTFRQEEAGGEDVQNCYLLLPWDDINLIIESINEDDEQTKIYFGCKGLKSILMVSPPQLTRELLDRFSSRLLKRLVVVLSYEHLPDTMVEALYIVVLLTNLMDYEISSEMIMSGLVLQLNKFIDIKFMQSRSSKIAAELALQIMANLSRISNLAVVHMQRVYHPEFQREDESTQPNLSFIDRMIQLCRFTEQTKPEVISPSHILETDQQQLNNDQGTTVLSQSALSNSCSLQVGQEQMTDLRIQMSYSVTNAVARSQELDEANTVKIVTLMLELVAQSGNISGGGPSKEGAQQELSHILNRLEIIWQEVIRAMRMMCGHSEMVCSVLDRHPSKSLFAKSLIEIAMYCHQDEDKMQLLMDTLVVIGDLTASDSFAERVFFVDFDFFDSLRAILNSPVLGKAPQTLLSTTVENEESSEALKINTTVDQSSSAQLQLLSRTKFQETILWTVTNALADDPDCQAEFISKHEGLLNDFFQLASVESHKVKLELCYLMDNLMASGDIKTYLFKKVTSDVNSSFKESDGEEQQLVQQADSEKPERKENFVKFLEVLATILSQRPLTGTDSDDQIEYQAIKNVKSLFRFDRRRMKAFVLGRESDENIGFAPLVEQVYRMQHHWSQRVYEKSLLISQRYLQVGEISHLHKLTELKAELCQESLFKPDPIVAEKQATEYVLAVKKKGKNAKKKGQDDDSESDDDIDEEARDRAVTFMMSVGEKRAYEVKKKMEKEYNLRFKTLFVTVVSSQMVCQAPCMMIIDMTNDSKKKEVKSPAASSEPKDTHFRVINLESASEKTIQEEDPIGALDNDPCSVPRLFLTYEKHLEIERQKALAILREKQAEDLKLRMAADQEMRAALDMAIKNSLLGKTKGTTDRGSSNEGSSRGERSRKSSIKNNQFYRRKSSVVSGQSLKSKDSKRRSSKASAQKPINSKLKQSSTTLLSDSQTKQSNSKRRKQSSSRLKASR